ncbi:hypothetical protein BGZ79_008839 [Entomortierella chlamydospora]|nr:hypothetical protein BGZ79_008839 [Entomortierella chlamydospora]
MARFSTLNSLSLALIALIFTSLIATLSVEATPIPNPALAAASSTTTKAKTSKPSFTVFAQTNLGGKSKAESGYGCHNHNLGTVGSVKYKSGPVAQINFYEGKNCTGKITHQMDTSTVKRMGGPYKSNSVKVFK